MEEKFLYHIWDEGHLKPEPKSICGKAIRIVYQGQFNTARGPDFRNAIIEIAGEQLRGDIEIHLKTMDWQAHTHHEDLYYNKVILHVVLEHNGQHDFSLSEDGRLIPILELKDQLSDDIDKLLTKRDIPSRRSVYCDLLSAVSNDNLITILYTAGLRRFKAKVKRFNALLSLYSFQQLFYEGLFEALGYDKNKLNTLQIAQSLPLGKLKEYKAEGMTAKELAALYAAGSGLLKQRSALIPDEISDELLKLYEAQPWLGKAMPIDWQLFRIRPQNHPLKRLIYIAPLIWEHLDDNILQYFIYSLEAYKAEPKAHYKAYGKLWQKHELFSGLSLILGKSVQDNIYLNILLPVLSLWEEKLGADARQIHELYSSFPGLQENYIIRFMARYMNPQQVKLVNSKAIYQQGILDIYHRYCNWHLCEECLKS